MKLDISFRPKGEIFIKTNAVFININLGCIGKSFDKLRMTGRRYSNCNNWSNGNL
jgi:hypothetical protein